MPHRLLLNSVEAPLKSTHNKLSLSITTIWMVLLCFDSFWINIINFFNIDHNLHYNFEYYRKTLSWWVCLWRHKCNLIKVKNLDLLLHYQPLWCYVRSKFYSLLSQWIGFSNYSWLADSKDEINDLVSFVQKSPKSINKTHFDRLIFISESLQIWL